MLAANGLIAAVRAIARRGRRLFSDRVPDRIALARRYKRIYGRPLNLKNPQTFNEKLFWLILHYRTPLVTKLADKYEVRGFVAERVGPRILNELYGVWDRVADVDFESLPDAFALKVNWGWGANVFCPRKSDLDVQRTKEQLTAWMRRSHYWAGREWCYKNIKPRIVCERLLRDDTWSSPTECCFYCFGGEPRSVRVHTDRSAQWGRDLFDPAWQPLPFTINWLPSGRVVPRPSNLDDMVACARQLSRGFPFVRVDLYSVAGRTVFAEMSWAPGAGTNRFSPESYDKYWGDALQLPPTMIHRWRLFSAA